MKIYDTRPLKERMMYPERIYKYSGSKKYLGQLSKRLKKAVQQINIDQVNYSQMYNYYPLFHDLWVHISMIQKQLRALYKTEEDLPKDLVAFYEEDLECIIDWIKQWHPQKIHNCKHCDNGSKPRGKTFCPYCFLGKTGGRLKDHVAQYHFPTD